VNATLKNASEVTQTTPLRLEVAARIAFPDGSMSVGALRRLIKAGQLTVEVIAGKQYLTLQAIEEMRTKCRVTAKDHKSGSENTTTADRQSGASATGSTASEKQRVQASVLARLSKRETVRSPTTSSSNKKTPRQKAAVIPIRR
jgi:hypothetical protein